MYYILHTATIVICKNITTIKTKSENMVNL